MNGGCTCARCVGVWLRLPDSGMCCWVGLIRHIANLASCGQAGGLIRYISIMWAGRRPAPVHLVHKRAGRRPAPVHCRPEACSGTNLAGTGQILLATLLCTRAIAVIYKPLNWWKWSAKLIAKHACWMAWVRPMMPINC